MRRRITKHFEYDWVSIHLQATELLQAIHSRVELYRFDGLLYVASDELENEAIIARPVLLQQTPNDR